MKFGWAIRSREVRASGFEDLCTGCGLCEQNCPIFDQAAIVVLNSGRAQENGEYASACEKVIRRGGVSLQCQSGQQWTTKANLVR